MLRALVGDTHERQTNVHPARPRLPLPDKVEMNHKILTLPVLR